jgi:hypothetical protein
VFPVIFLDRIRWRLTGEGKNVLFEKGGMQLKSQDQRAAKKKWGLK